MQPSDTGAAEPLILEVITRRPQGNPTGIRVYADGRYETLGDTHIDVTAEGRPVMQQVPLAWRTAFVYSDDALSTLRQAIRDANFPALDQQYRPEGPVHDAATMVWRANVEGQIYEVTVEGYPHVQVPALETLLERLQTVRQLPATSSVWRVWVAGRVEQRTVACDVSQVSQLRPLVQALFVPSEGAADVAGSPSDPPELADDTVVLEVLWHEAGRPDTLTRVYADGRHIQLIDGEETQIKTFSPHQLRMVLEAGAAIDWANLPDPVCS